MILARSSMHDPTGISRCYLAEGEFTDDPVTIQGGSAVCRVLDLQGLLDLICKNGFEHHVAMVRSNCADVLEEAIDTYLDWDMYVHV